MSPVFVGPILERRRQEDCHECESSWNNRDPVSKEKTLGSGEVNSTQENPFTVSEDSWQCVTRIVTRQLISKIIINVRIRIETGYDCGEQSNLEEARKLCGILEMFCGTTEMSGVCQNSSKQT